MTIKVVGIQTSITASKEYNLKSAIKLLDKASKLYNELDIACFPELFYKIPLPNDADEVAEAVPNKLTKIFSEKAKEYNIYIIAGSFLEKKNNNRYNTSILFDRGGNIAGSYTKTHLFDALGFKESDISIPGERIPVFKTDFGKIGITICYDLRFPELYRTLALKGAKIIFVPSAFISPRMDHWDILVRSAALQNLNYVVALNLFGEYKGIKFFGRSMIVDPWGIPLSIASDKESIVYGNLDLEYLEEIRKHLPVFKHRKPELYEL